MGSRRTLLNKQHENLGVGRYGRKKPFVRQPFGSTRILEFPFGHIKMLHPTKGVRWRGMSDTLYNLFVLSQVNALDAVVATAQSDAKIHEYWGIYFENARQQAVERHYPLR